MEDTNIEKGQNTNIAKDASPITPNTNSRKRHMDESDNEEELVIDTSPNTRSRNRNKNRGRKRKRISSTSSTEFVLTSNTLELEKNLQASALKNNLDDTSVKKIIKKVVTNDHVLALVKLRDEEASSTDEDIPTLTRSKAKNIKKVPRVTAPWNLQLEPIEHIPVKTRPEVEALIAQELPEDEDDEEYNPTNDDIPLLTLTENRKPKEVVYWLAKLKIPEQNVTLSDEHQDLKWLPLQQAQEISGFEDMKNLLADFHEEASKML